jgi:hypothetical protein
MAFAALSLWFKFSAIYTRKLLREDQRNHLCAHQVQFLRICLVLVFAMAINLALIISGTVMFTNCYPSCSQLNLRLPQQGFQQIIFSSILAKILSSTLTSPSPSIQKRELCDTSVPVYQHTLHENTDLL